MQKAKNSTSPSPDPRLTRIRNNQRRSRARRKEYLEDLEARWKKCQEMGVQANVDLQKAARKVIEENRLLRTILKESGVPDDVVERRIKEMSVAAVTVATNNESPAEGSSSAACVAKPSSNEALETAQRTEAMTVQNEECCSPSSSLEACLLGTLSQPSALLSTAELDEIFSANSLLDNPPSSNASTVGAPSTLGPDSSNLGFDFSSFDSQQLADINIDPSIFLQDLSTTTSPLPAATTASSPGGLESMEALPEELTGAAPLSPSNPSSMSSICPPFLPYAPSTLPPHPNACNISKSGSTPCTIAYQLLKSINAMRRNEKDMFEIVLELWNGFSLVEGDQEGCRVDNEVLFRVVGGLAEQRDDESDVGK